MLLRRVYTPSVLLLGRACTSSVPLLGRACTSSVPLHGRAYTSSVPLRGRACTSSVRLLRRASTSSVLLFKKWFLNLGRWWFSFFAVEAAWLVEGISWEVSVLFRCELLEVEAFFKRACIWSSNIRRASEEIIINCQNDWNFTKFVIIYLQTQIASCGWPKVFVGIKIPLSRNTYWWQAEIYKMHKMQCNSMLIKRLFRNLCNVKSIQQACTHRSFRSVVFIFHPLGLFWVWLEQICR